MNLKVKWAMYEGVSDGSETFHQLFNTIHTIILILRKSEEHHVELIFSFLVYLMLLSEIIDIIFNIILTFSYIVFHKYFLR